MKRPAAHQTRPAGSLPPDGVNATLVVGEVSSQPILRELAGGATVLQFDVTARVDGRRTSAPVSWFDPPANSAAALAPAMRVVVVGRVERRFFRSGGTTRSRTEVVADQVVQARRRAAVARCVTGWADTIQGSTAAIAGPTTS